MNIGKNIEILKELKEFLQRNDVEDMFSSFDEEIEAISNVISELEETKQTLKCTQDSWYKDTQELETWKKIAEKLAEELSKHIWLNDKDAIIKIYREEVEEDETHILTPLTVKLNYIPIKNVLDMLDELDDRRDKGHITGYYSKREMLKKLLKQVNFDYKKYKEERGQINDRRRKGSY